MAYEEIYTRTSVQRVENAKATDARSDADATYTCTLFTHNVAVLRITHSNERHKLGHA